MLTFFLWNRVKTTFFTTSRWNSAGAITVNEMISFFFILGHFCMTENGIMTNWLTFFRSFQNNFGLWSGLSSPKQSSKLPQIELWSTIYRWRFYQISECRAYMNKRKASLSKTFWRRFCKQLSFLRLVKKLFQPIFWNMNTSTFSSIFYK